MQRASLLDYYADRFTKVCLGEPIPRLRTVYGDVVDLGPTRMVLAALMAYSPEVRAWLYEIGRSTGRALAEKLRERGILAKFLDGQIKNPIGNFARKNLPKGGVEVRVAGNVYSEGLPLVGVNFDRFLAGVIASLCSVENKRPMGAVEVACYASGAGACQFKVAFLDSQRAGNESHESEKWEGAMEKILPEYVRRDMTGEYTKIRESLGDEIDVSIVRLLASAIFSYSPEVKAWVYQIGKKLGTIAADQMPESAKTDMAETLREKGEVAVQQKDGAFKIQLKGGDRYDFTLYECAVCYGNPILDEPFGYLEAGYVAGMFEKMTGHIMGAREVKCATKGDPYCVFEVRRLE